MVFSEASESLELPQATRRVKTAEVDIAGLIKLLIDGPRRRVSRFLPICCGWFFGMIFPPWNRAAISYEVALINWWRGGGRFFVSFLVTALT
ncbi:hypothetical protein [Corynebacterium glyciniphilum]|uniref:hypothetical protein n=1 Tax=Corynebacterium glyciniphilum TaxID=1404244 RepID=UPI0021B25CBF|nr:hypothetical protein [Corynebacterium glyciniphilum]